MCLYIIPSHWKKTPGTGNRFYWGGGVGLGVWAGLGLGLREYKLRFDLPSSALVSVIFLKCVFMTHTRN